MAMKYFELYNGLKIPVLGMGTYPLNGLRLSFFTACAPTCIGGGYSLIDTASAYSNEYWIGYGIRLSPVPRSRFFVTSKLSNSEQRNGNVRNALLKSIKKMAIKKIDLYLMHWPNPETYLDCWKKMEDLYDEGLVRAIGVCNFHQHHLENIFSSSRIRPMVNQIELHPLLSQKPLVDFCNKHDVQVEAYSPLARMHQKLIHNEALLEIAKNKQKTLPQVVFRWNYQCGIIPIPKCSSLKRLRENIDIFNFELSTEEMQRIDNLNCNFRVRHDPDNCDFYKL
jgi:methylglyoxal/glyoxal reductase